jgi:hypothetical protein
VVAAVEEKWVQRVAQDLRSAEARRIIEHSIPAVTTEGGSSSTGNPPGGDMPPRHR